MKKIIGIIILSFLIMSSSVTNAKNFYNKESYTFLPENSNIEYIMLEDKGDSILVSPVNDWGISEIKSAFALINGKKFYNDISSEIRNYSISNYWEVAGESRNGIMTLPSSEMITEYGELLNNNVGINSNKNWLFYKNKPYNKDTDFFERVYFEYNNNPEILFDECGKFVKNKNSAEIYLSQENEFIIGFKADFDGTYIVNADFSDIANGKKSLVRMTKYRNEYIFDGDFVGSFEYSGNETQWQEEISLKKNDCIFLHIMPGEAEYKIDLSITVNDTVYSLVNDISSTDDKFLLSDVIDGNYMAASNEGELFKIGSDDKMFLNPVFCLKKDYFKQNRLDMKRTGKAVFSMIKNSVEKSDLNIYSDFELEDIYNIKDESFTFTDDISIENGIASGCINIKNTTGEKREFSYILAEYKDDKLIGVEISNNIIGAYTDAKVTTTIATDGTDLKTFLWDGKMTPLSEKKGSYMSFKLESDISENFSFYKSSAAESNFNNYTRAEVKKVNSLTTVNSGYSSFMSIDDDISTITIQNDTGNSDGKGELKTVFTVPESGDWEFKIQYKNIGTDVFGGDGGSIRFEYLTSENEIRRIREVGMPMSVHSGMDWLVSSDCISAFAGDKIIMSMNAGFDGFGDRWLIKYEINQKSEGGRNVIKRQDLTELSDPSIKNNKRGVDLKDNLVWLAMDSGLGDTTAGKEFINYFKKYIPGLGVIYASSKPEQYCVGQDFFISKNIPLLAQGYGQQYINYFNRENAFEYSWDDIALSIGNHPHYLSGTGHAVSMPHYAFTEAFGRKIKAAATNGFSAVGYCDYVWAYCEAMGSCRNPQTKKAFIEDLLERDEGLRIVEDDDIINYNFWDYYEYYFGSPEIAPVDIGIDSWENYQPITKSEYETLVENGKKTDRYFGLQDLLVHYEMLKAAQFLADTADSVGISFQIMPNPEWSPDGNDFLFLNKIDGLDIVTNEYFGSPSYLDGAYQRFDYLSEKNDTSWGAVMEAGGGGTSEGYYAPEIAYLTAYELGACGAEHMECDFLFNASMQALPLSNAAQRRDTQLLSFGMGFSDAKKDNLKKRKSDFISVSDRHIVRPLMNSYIWLWEPWDLWLKQDLSTDFGLYKMGYRFDSISQEGIKEISDTKKMVIYSADMTTKEGMDTFLEKLKDGTFENAIVSAHNLKYTFDNNTYSIVDASLNTDKLINVYPEFSFTERGESIRTGNVADSSGSSVSGVQYTLAGKTYRNTSQDTIMLRFKTSEGSINPLLAKRKIGNSTLYILLFDPTIDENYELSAMVYEYIMNPLGIERQWISIADEGKYQNNNYWVEYDENGNKVQQTTITDEYGATVRIYENENMTVAGVQNSLSRYVAGYNQTTEGGMVPYHIDGKTEVKIKMTPGKSYRYIAIPSLTEGNFTADKNGYITLSFEDTSHELFFILPSDADMKVFDEYKSRIDTWNDALTFGGIVERIYD